MEEQHKNIPPCETISKEHLYDVLMQRGVAVYKDDKKVFRCQACSFVDDLYEGKYNYEYTFTPLVLPDAVDLDEPTRVGLYESLKKVLTSPFRYNKI